MIQGITLGDISIDCNNPLELRDFYANITAWEMQTKYDCPALVTDSNLIILFMDCDFEYSPPVWPEELGQQQKQVHFNF